MIYYFYFAKLHLPSQYPTSSIYDVVLNVLPDVNACHLEKICIISNLATFSPLSVSIYMDIVQLITNDSCDPRMSCEMQFCLSLLTNKIFLMQWMLLKSLISWVSTLFASVTGRLCYLYSEYKNFLLLSTQILTASSISSGTSRALAPPLGRGFMRGWIGSPTTLLTR